MSSVSSKSPVPGASIKQASRQNVRVVCRVRPTNQREVKEGGITCVKHSDSNIEVNNDGATNTFNFDRIFGPESTQIEVFYDTAMPLVRDVLSGYNATIFAYGQTGTGKVSLFTLVCLSLSKYANLSLTHTLIDSYYGR